MWHITKFFWQLCLLRESPASLPASNFATAMVFAVYLAIGASSALIRRPGDSGTAFLGTMVIAIALQLAATLLLLEFKGVRYRFQQTWTALLGASSIISILIMSMTLLFLNTEPGIIQMFAETATWVCFGWWLVTAGYIYHTSLNISVLQGASVAFLIELITIIVSLTIFPR